jgi:hypothetical protein
MSAWLDLLARVLHPARPTLAWCADEAGRHARERRPIAEARARAVADCVARIEAARADVFEANDGVVTGRMTALEAEWRSLSRRADRDGDAMDLWARIAPLAWRDQKKWRVGDPARYADAAIALASDVAGVETAEAAIDALRKMLPLPSRTRWCFDDGTDVDIRDLLATPLLTARGRLHARDGARFAEEGATELMNRVHADARERLPERPRLATSLAHAAFVDTVWAITMADEPSPTAALFALWRTGYTIAWIDAAAVTLAIPTAALT